MKTILTIILTFIVSVCIAQKVVHHNYTSYYNAKTKEPDSVIWNETPAMVACKPVTRKNPFKQDPLVPNSATPDDYAVNGAKLNPLDIDKGHLHSYQDAMCMPFDVYECFYMSNMLPQIHAFNAGDWKTLEVQERIWAKKGTIHILAGGIGINTSIKQFPNGHLPKGEVIPAYMWKAIYMGGKWTAWIMPNQVTSVGGKWDKWIVPLAELDSKTGLHLQ